MIIHRGQQPDSNTALWACLSRLQDHKNGGSIHHDTLAANAGVFFAAGFETTAHAITWAVFELAADPELQVSHAIKQLKQSSEQFLCCKFFALVHVSTTEPWTATLLLYSLIVCIPLGYSLFLAESVSMVSTTAQVHTVQYGSQAERLVRRFGLRPAIADHQYSLRVMSVCEPKLQRQGFTIASQNMETFSSCMRHLYR